MTDPLTASTTVADVLRKRPLAARVLLNHRMHCLGCEIAPFETLEEACGIYGVSVRDLLAELNATTTESAGPETLANLTFISKITRLCHTCGGTQSRFC
jgi:hybrid cluster-associated redox disulfide protein